MNKGLKLYIFKLLKKGLIKDKFTAIRFGKTTYDVAKVNTSWRDVDCNERTVVDRVYIERNGIIAEPIKFGKDNHYSNHLPIETRKNLF